MKEFWNMTQVVIAGIGGWLGWFLGGCDGLLYALIAFVVIDYITGVMCAVVDKNLSSEVGFRGIFKKVLIFLLVRNRSSFGCTGDWNRKCSKNCSDFLLYFK